MPLAGYLALGSLNGLTFTEITNAPAYARQAVTLDPAGEAGRVANVAGLAFPVVVDRDWPGFGAYALYDAASGGNLLMAWPYGQVTRVRRGARWRVGAGQIELSFPAPRAKTGELILNAGFSASLGRVFTSFNQVVLTQAQYDALGAKDPLTLYVIVAAS